MRKKIGIVGSKLGENSFGATINYLRFIEYFGADPIILMPHQEYVELDGLILPGGLDLPPSVYGQHPSFDTSNHDVHKMYFMTERLSNYIGKIPIFGICLGFQMLNVAFNGSLVQNFLFHPQSKERWEKGHEVKFEESSWEVVGCKPPKGNKGYEVNSHHHQGVTLSTLGQGLKILASTDNYDNESDPIVEAFIHESLPIAGVQWHPEEWYDKYAVALFNKILNQ